MQLSAAATTDLHVLVGGLDGGMAAPLHTSAEDLLVAVEEDLAA